MSVVKYWTTFRSIKIPAHELAKFAPLPEATARARIIRKWNVEVALVLEAANAGRVDAGTSHIIARNLTEKQKEQLDAIEVKAKAWKANLSKKPVVAEPVDNIDAQFEELVYALSVVVNQVFTDTIKRIRSRSKLGK